MINITTKTLEDLTPRYTEAISSDSKEAYFRGYNDCKYDVNHLLTEMFDEIKPMYKKYSGQVDEHVVSQILDMIKTQQPQYYDILETFIKKIMVEYRLKGISSVKPSLKLGDQL